MFEIIKSESIKEIEEIEEFVSSSPYGNFMQSKLWGSVKSNWEHFWIISRDDNGKIRGSISVLCQKILSFSFLYAPRAPVCSPEDTRVLTELFDGIKKLAKLTNAHTFKTDPDVLANNAEFISFMESIGFNYHKGGENFETIQPRFNYRLPINNRSESEMLANFTQKTRYNIRIAEKHGVEVKVCDSNYLDDFMRLMEITGKRDGFNIRPRSYFQNMLDVFGKNARLYLSFYQNQAISGAITINYANKVSYVYGASDNANRNVMPNYLMQWEMIKWAIAEKAVYYDFQGVSGALDPSNPLYGLYRFKKGFNGELIELAGEFDLLLKPKIAKAIDSAVATRSKIYKIKSKLNGK